MRHPDSILPLLIALAIAVVLHAALLPVGATMLSRSSTLPTQTELEIAITQSPESLVVGEDGTVSLEIINRGDANASNATWKLYWSDTPRLVENAPFHAEARDDPLPQTGFNEIAAGQSMQGSFQVTALEGHDGPRFIVATAKADNAAEVTASTSIWVESQTPAQIKIDSVDVAAKAYAGGTTSVGYTLRNSPFAGWAKGGWIDRVVLSPDEQVSGEDLVLLNVPRRRPLAPGQSSEVGPFDLRIPLGVAPGTYHIIVESGAPNAEPFVTPLRIEPATHPDLAPRNIKLSSGENQITVGEPTVLHFDVVNRSPLAAPDLLWGDRVYWSADDEVSDDDVMLISQPRGAYPGELPGGGAYRSGPHEFVISPEMVLSPTMYLIVVADDENDIAEGDYAGNNALAMPIVIKQEVEAEKPDELKLGRDDEPARVTVAWIAHDDFQELLARESVTLQPILQDKVDPTPNAPLERDPEDTGNPAVVAPPPAPPTPNPADAQTPASRQTADTSVDPVDTDNAGELPNAAPGAVDQTGDSTQDSPGIAQPNPTSPQSPPESPPTVASQEQGEKPTSAPRSDREVDPTTLIQAKSVRPGQVLVGPGIEIKTFRPQWSAAARFALPRNPKVVITFDPDGTVLEAAFITSTGFDNVDGPLLSSLYRWKATGKSLQEITKPFPIELTILLGDSDPPEEEKKEEGGS
ncbi:CARDB domain-containing protein [Algisphaera agarilytica]|uniref:CARDB domain-containing protein n=1 Tax=Algisphaera agarilytica TaxID=1385975 RepID=A0A7X0H7D2_9BACT|nr:CARDB domain-containing protein [Algisphaera agarilytica]MBB6430628.1 hypothetical protein [Algisphaera agarilytica]